MKSLVLYIKLNLIILFKFSPQAPSQSKKANKNRFGRHQSMDYYIVIETVTIIEGYPAPLVEPEKPKL